MDVDSQNEVIVGPEGLQKPFVRRFDGFSGASEGTQVLAYGAGFRGGMRVGVLPGFTVGPQTTILVLPGKGLAVEITLSASHEVTTSESGHFYISKKELISSSLCRPPDTGKIARVACWRQIRQRDRCRYQRIPIALPIDRAYKPAFAHKSSAFVPFGVARE